MGLSHLEHQKTVCSMLGRFEKQPSGGRRRPNLESKLTATFFTGRLTNCIFVPRNEKQLLGGWFHGNIFNIVVLNTFLKQTQNPLWCFSHLDRKHSSPAEKSQKEISHTGERNA